MVGVSLLLVLYGAIQVAGGPAALAGDQVGGQAQEGENTQNGARRSIHAFCEQAFGKRECGFSIADEDWHDRTDAVGQAESQLC